MTILRLSGFLYGEQIRASVFEPLLADRHQELTADRHSRYACDGGSRSSRP
jgi:hypothetical protein